MAQLTCVECGADSGWFARGWLAIRCEDPKKEEAPELAFYCPVCACIELGIDLQHRLQSD
jgi:hypothetical protein